MRLSISTSSGWILVAVVMMAIGLPGARVALAQDPPQIVDQPDNAEACDGGAATFTVVASGDPPLEYQWYEEGIAIWAADEASYTIDPVGPGAEGVFHVLVSNPYGSVQSNVVTLTIHEGPSITQQPQDQTLCEGENFTLSVTATGFGTLFYQWRVDGVDIPGAESDEYTVVSATRDDTGDYDVVLTDDCGQVTSSIAPVTVKFAPSIVTDPDDADACVDDSVAFEVVADGSPFLSYQWYHNGLEITGATSSIYEIDEVELGDAGTYHALVENVCGDALSGTATLTVNVGPTIATGPQSQVACDGAAEVSFSVTATGSDPLAYLWRKDGIVIPGADSDTYTITSVDPNDAASYDVVVANSCGSAISDVAMLAVVLDIPTIVEQPEGAALCDDVTPESITFTVTATPPDGLTYQWRKDGVDVPGAIESSYTINDVDVGDAGDYDVIVSNPCGDSFSDVATLIVVDEWPNIVEGPQHDTVCDGQPVTFTVTAEGPEPLSYQWYGPTGLIPGATQASYTIDPVAMDDAGNYRVEVSNPCATISSAQATLSVIDDAPGIDQQPQSVTRCEGETQTFSVVPTGDPEFEYQWYKGVDPIDGATGQSLELEDITVDDAGEYRVTVTNACGFAESDAATLTVNTAVVITQQPVSQELCENELVEFSVQVSGTEPYEYQWYKDDEEIVGATESTYSIASITPADAGSYQVKVSNTCSVDGVYSDPATLTVFLEPTITQQPAAPELCVGDAVTLSVVATGTEPFTYQWYKDGQPIGGATDSTFTIDPLSAADSGEYHAVVTNLCDQDVSDPVTLVVDEPPLIVTQPAPAIIAHGQTHVFCVAVDGTEPFEYQWRKDGVNIAGATANCYEASEAGLYACVVTNRCDVVVSNAAELTIAPRLIVSAIADPPGVRLGNPSTLTAAADRGLAPYAYLWSTGATTAAIVVTPTENTVYSVTASDALGQTATTDVTVVVAAPLTVQTRASAYMLWPGESSTLTASVLTGGLVPFTYAWSTGATAASIVVSPTSDTTYYVTVTDSLGQTGTASVTIMVNQEAKDDDQSGAKQPPTDGSGDGDQTDEGDGDGDQGDGTGEEEEDQGGQVPPTAGLCPLLSLTMISLLVAGVCWARGAKPRRRQ